MTQQHPNGVQPTAAPSDPGCICKGNWRLIVSEAQHLLGRKFRRDDGTEYSFFGLVHADDDYYYGMWRNGDLRLLSCVGSIEGHGYALIPAGVQEKRNG